MFYFYYRTYSMKNAIVDLLGRSQFDQNTLLSEEGVIRSSPNLPPVKRVGSVFI